MIKIATPISTLFTDVTLARRIAGASDCLECRDQSAASALPYQELFHSEAELIHPWPENLRVKIRKVFRGKPELAMATFHAASCCSAPVLKNRVYQPGGILYTAEQMREHARTNVAWLRSFLPSSVAIGIENNNYYPTPAYDVVTDGSFLTAIAEENELTFLLDIAHAHVTAWNRHLSYEAYRASLPLSRLVQLHISQSTVEDGLALDAHRAPGQEECAEVQALISRHPSVRYLTLEYYQDAAVLLALLGEYRKIFPF